MKMTIGQMRDKMDKLMPKAVADVKENGWIDDIFSYMISNEEHVNVDNETGESTIISICMYDVKPYFGEGEGDVELSLAIVGIDDEGVVDLVHSTEATLQGLESIVERFDKIVIDGGYDKAEQFHYMG
jgi:hypothetical protein